MKIFEATADQISRLKDFQLVDLLRRLISAELKKHGIPLAAGAASAQLNIPDGGEDGRVAWKGGPVNTDFLPHRYTIFQCKRTDPGPAALKAEVWKKSSQGKGVRRELNEAIVQALKKGGAYIVVTGSAVVGTNVTRRIEAIKEGVRDAGGEPSKLAAIEIIDSNKLASWTTSHPSVALWLNSEIRDIHLHGFRNFEAWSLDKKLKEVAFQCLNEERFLIRGSSFRNLKKDHSNIQDRQSVESLGPMLEVFFQGYGKALRVVGPSGYGKTRLVHELLTQANGRAQDFLDQKKVIYAMHDDVKDIIINIARELNDSGSNCLLIVDDCSDDVHMRIWDAMGYGGNGLQLITLGVEEKKIDIEKNLFIEVLPASNELIEGIAKDIFRDTPTFDSVFVRELAQGFPRMAVLAAHAAKDGDLELASAEALIDRIIWNGREPNDEALFALQTLSLFTALGIENNASEELDEISNFIDCKSQSLFRIFSSFRDRGIVLRRGDFAEVQPLPLAMRLANAWLASMPRGTLERLFREIRPKLQLRLAGRLRWVSWSTQVSSAAEKLLDELLETKADLDTDHGSKLLDRFVHLAPDRVMHHLNRLLGSSTIEELESFNSGRRHTVWALEKLVFRKETFPDAANLLMRLGAAENEDWGNNATGQFKSLFKLHLSGTEADPKMKHELLNDGLNSPDPRIRKICIDALESMLTTHHFSRSGGQERIGVSEPLNDWSPKTYGEIFDYYRFALDRLNKIALDDTDSFQELALGHIEIHLRGLFQIPAIIDEVVAVVRGIKESRPRWHQGISSVGDWLYFDQIDYPEDYIARLRLLYDELMPEGLIEKIMLYSAGWRLELRDPDKTYSRDSTLDLHYSQRIIEKLIESCPRNASYFNPLIEEFSGGSYHNSPMALALLATHVRDPENLITQTACYLESDKFTETIVEMLRAIISGINRNDGAAARAHLEALLDIDKLTPHTVELMLSVGIDEPFFVMIIDRLSAKIINPKHTNFLGAQDLLRALNPSLVEKFVNVLIDLGAEGTWAAIDFLLYSLNFTDALEQQEGNLIKLVTTHPYLLDKARPAQMDSYHWSTLIKKLFENGLVDKKFAEKCVRLINSVINVSDYSFQLNFAGQAREVLSDIAKTHPEILWEIYTEQLHSLTNSQRYRLSNLYGPEHGHPSNAGVLDLIPTHLVLPWVVESRAERVPIVLGWIRIFETAESSADWDSKFLSFVEQYVYEPAEMRAIASRLTTGTCWGSFANKLAPELERLDRLGKKIKNPVIIRWIADMRQRLDRSIESTRRDDENREVGLQC